MNTFFALYLWLMQTLGVTGPVLLPAPADTVHKNPYTLSAPPTPPPPTAEYTAQSDRDVTTFISNGF